MRMIPSELPERVVYCKKSKKLKRELKFALSEVEALCDQKGELVTRIENLIGLLDSRTNRCEGDERCKRMLDRVNLNPISGLPNHNSLDINLVNFFESNGKNSKSGAIVLLKLDNNFDILSIPKPQKSSVSSWLIHQIGLRLKERIGEGGVLYHIRNDEFLLHIFGVDSAAEFSSFLTKIGQQISKPHIFAGQRIEIGCAMGVTLYPKDGCNKNELLSNTDIALSEARKKNKNYAFFEPRMQDDILRTINTRNSIIQALERNSGEEADRQLYLAFQPIVNVSQMKENEPIIDNIDAEALIRWENPIDGNVPPDAFIPIAEETGIMDVIGKWVLYTAVAQIEEWKWQQIDSRLAINVSPRQFHNNDVIDSIQKIIRQGKVDPEKLQVEITENSFLDDPRDANKKIRRLKDLGIKVAIDDFGIGFSSINYLRQLPVDAIKIDRSFVSDLTASTQNRSIVKAIIAITREMGMINIAEGVETMEQLELLMQLGISTFQGFLFSKALSPDHYTKFYRKFKRNEDT